MQPATVHLLTAFHGLTHRVSLTADDEAALARGGASLSPKLWRATVALLAEADRGAPGTRVDIGFEPLLHRWLGVEDEAGFAQTHGLGMAEALERDRGALGALAEAIESGAGSEAVRDLVSHAWTSRAAHLMGGLPGTAGPVVEALDRAIEGCPWPASRRRGLFEAMAVASEALGDWGRAEDARKWLERLDREDALGYLAAQVLLILWCVTHDELLLSFERGLDPGIDPSPAGWARVRVAVEAGRPEDVPAPVATFAAWSLGDGLEEYVLRISLEQQAPLLPDMARVVELLLEGGDAPESLSEPLSLDAARFVLNALGRRRDHVEGGYRPLAGERQNLFCEAHQGARRPETMERLALVHRLHEALERCADIDPLAAARVHLDRAAECESRGEHEETRAHLERACELAGRVAHDPARRDGAQACLAEWRWRSGDPAQAGRMVKDVRGPKAAELLRRIEASEPGRAAVRRAERAVRQRADLESRCELAHAHVAAGHAVAGERMAAALCRSHPDEPLAWTTLARVLEGNGRYRDAVEPAREALARSCAEAPGRVLLARILGRLGPDGRQESTALAGAAIEAHPEGEPLRSNDLAEAVRIAHEGGADLEICRRGDDQVWALRAAGEPPEEWLGAAVARRCHGVWAPDAPEWLARLAAVAADEPAELARFVVERVEALQYFRLLVARSLFGAVEGLEAEAAVYARASTLLTERHGRRIEEEGSAATAAASLGAGEPDPDAGVGPALHWLPHLAAIEAGLGRELALRLRASELAQGAFFAADGAGERERIVHLHTLERERGDWIRWAGARDPLHDLAEGFGGGLSAGAAARLEPLLELSRGHDDEEVRASAWATRWHEAERRSAGVSTRSDAGPGARCAGRSPEPCAAAPWAATP